ncbi:MAG: endonuclease [Planctomycetota bacterium]
MRNFRALLVSVLCFTFAVAAVADPWAAPSGYYDRATGSGATLEAQLAEIMADGHRQQRYGDFRDSAAIHDADPDRPGNILLGYDRASVSAAWDSGRTWNREHVWPQSRQPGSASNATRGNLGDPHALRPADPGVNSSRGNKPFGVAGSSGSFGAESGGYYFPGDVDKGDVARSLFYSATRYGLDLVLGVPSGNAMGDLEALLAWHRDDPPDDFERRRNHTIYSQAENPNYYTNNRNAFIDEPEFAYSVFALVGDANLDFVIDQEDLAVVLSNWGGSGGWVAGDFDRSGFVEQADLNIVLNGWGGSASPSFVGYAVPEPGMMAGACVFGLGVLIRRRSKTAPTTGATRCGIW